MQLYHSLLRPLLLHHNIRDSKSKLTDDKLNDDELTDDKLTDDK